MNFLLKGGYIDTHLDYDFFMNQFYVIISIGQTNIGHSKSECFYVIISIAYEDFYEIREKRVHFFDVGIDSSNDSGI